jgi:hypothetical protein
MKTVAYLRKFSQNQGIRKKFLFQPFNSGEPNMGTQYRQGDVWIERIDALPEVISPVPGPTILAHGEVTGHAHEVKRYGKLFKASDGQLFLKMACKGILEHQEHDPITLPAGVYRVRRQREYSPEAIRMVVD